MSKKPGDKEEPAASAAEQIEKDATELRRLAELGRGADDLLELASRINAESRRLIASLGGRPSDPLSAYIGTGPLSIGQPRARGLVLLALALILGLAWGAHRLLFMGHGLKGFYYADTTFENFFASRTDRSVNFNWDHVPPFRGFPRENFSVLWTGHLEVPFGKEYTFEIVADDGARLWIDDKLIVDDRADPNPRGYGDAWLSQGRHFVKLEYVQRDKGSHIRIRWKKIEDKSFEPIDPLLLTPA